MSSSSTAESSVVAASDARAGSNVNSPYSDAQLRQALDSLVDPSASPDEERGHLHGYNNDNNEDYKLSALQTITATRILDYRDLLSKPETTPTEGELVKKATDFRAQHGEILNLQSVIADRAPRMALAAEFKRASPSKGLIAPDLRADQQAVRYREAGADIISCLTEERWFRGTLADLTEARLATQREQQQQQQQADADGSNKRRPAMLRKDFIFSTYQIAEAVAAGADTVLLIVAVLPATLLKQLIDYCRARFGMEPLVEIHADEELQVALRAGAAVIGVNNRNLHTFKLDLRRSEEIAERLRRNPSESSGVTLCALSGMSTAADVDRYRRAGLGMCLIGESLMRAADPVAAISSLCLHPDDFEKQRQGGGTITAGGAAYTGGTKLVKVCGITNAEDALVACRAGANLIGMIFVPNTPRCVTAERATEIVEAVRAFGERAAAVSLDSTRTTDASCPPLVHLQGCARALQNAAASIPLVVGVFQNQDLDYVKETAAAVGLDLVQLHGNEGMEAASRCGVPAIRVVDIPPAGQDDNDNDEKGNPADSILASLTDDPIAILLDTTVKGGGSGGGTGKTFDWSVAEQLQASGLPCIIAGGLAPGDTVADCVGCVRPFGVDVSSGVEGGPVKGRKDHEKVREFCQQARRVAHKANKGF